MMIFIEEIILNSIVYRTCLKGRFKNLMSMKNVLLHPSQAPNKNAIAFVLPIYHIHQHTRYVRYTVPEKFIMPKRDI